LDIEDWIEPQSLRFLRKPAAPEHRKLNTEKKYLRKEIFQTPARLARLRICIFSRQ
jgi:hypothetical protein